MAGSANLCHFQQAEATHPLERTRQHLQAARLCAIEEVLTTVVQPTIHALGESGVTTNVVERSFERNPSSFFHI